MNRVHKTIGTVAITGTLAMGGTVAVDTQINPYDDRGTHYELILRSDIEQGERVEIAKDRAEMTLKGWNDEYAITITPNVPEDPLLASGRRGVMRERTFETQASRALFSKRMEYRRGDVTAFIEPKEGTYNEFDIDFTLESNPGTNVFTYTIAGAENFDFFYQPALTPEEIEEGVERPERVVGSYAVYHREKANHKVGETNYGTGKAFHIYRPEAIDARGNRVWAELDYTAGILSVTVPQDFLDSAVYPVVVDPTFGYTSAGSSHVATCFKDFGTPYTKRAGMPHIASETGTLSTLHGYFKGTGATDHLLAIYEEDGNGANSHSKISDVEIAYSGTAGWFSGSVSGSISASTSYIMANTCDPTPLSPVIGSSKLATDFSGSEDYFFGDGSYSFPDPWNISESGTGQKYSIYATYTASGGGADRRIIITQ